MSKQKGGSGGGSGFWATVKTAFAFGLGGLCAAVIFGLVGAGLFVGGYALKNAEDRKEEEDQEQWKKITGIVLMVLGVAVGGGWGGYALLGEVAEEL
jgi:hypothetical protein